MRAFTLNRDQIKGIAMMTMLLNHISQIFMTSGTFWAELFLDVGWFTAITMCYFLVEGYAYTHDKRRYALRLEIFAVISQPAYLLAFPEEGWYKLNILFTLLLSFVILVVREQIARKCWRNLAIVGLFLVSLVCDWAILAPAFTLLFAWAGRDAHKRPRAFLASILLFGAMNFFGGIGRFSLAQNLGYALAAMSGPALAAIAICCFYNGQRATRGRTAAKWFFYIFYPAHLAVLGVIRIILA